MSKTVQKQNILGASEAYKGSASLPTKLMIEVVIFLTSFLATPVREQVAVSCFVGTQALQVAKRALYYSGIEADAAKFGVGRYLSKGVLSSEQSEARSAWFEEVNGMSFRQLLAAVEVRFPDFAALSV